MSARSVAIPLAGLMVAAGVQLGTAVHGWSEVLTTGFVAGMLINLASVIYALYQVPPDQQPKVNRPIPAWAIVFVGAAMLTTAACGQTTRHVSTRVAGSITALVVSVDDSAKQLCATHVLNAAQCASLNTPILNALKDARALDKAVKDMSPTSTAMPKNIPDFLADLNAIQKIVNDLGGGPTFKPVSDTLLSAQRSVADLLVKLIGG